MSKTPKNPNRIAVHLCRPMCSLKKNIAKSDNEKPAEPKDSKKDKKEKTEKKKTEKASS